MIKYQLSNKHAKELRVRGRRIRVALPIDVDEDPPDWIAWAEQRLILQSGERITSAEPMAVWTARSVGNPTGMEMMFGSIIDSPGECGDERLPLSVEIVAVTISPEKVRSNPHVGLKWPGKAYRGEVTFGGADNGEAKT